MHFRHNGAAAVAAALLAFFATACDPGGDGGGMVHGFVLEVSARSLVEVEVLRVEDEEGAVWELSGRGYRGVSPSHLRQHMLQGMPVVVTYEEEDGELRIREVADYAEGATPAPHE